MNGNTAAKKPINYHVLEGLRLLQDAFEAFKAAEREGSGLGELLARKTHSALWLYDKEMRFRVERNAL